MTAGPTELVVVLVVALLLFGPAIVLAWGGYMLGRKRGREEGAAEARAEIADAAERPTETVDDEAETPAEGALATEEDTDE